MESRTNQRHPLTTLTEQQRATLSSVLRPDDCALIVNALREKTQGNLAAAEALPETQDVDRLRETLVTQAAHARTLAECMEDL